MVGSAVVLGLAGAREPHPPSTRPACSVVLVPLLLREEEAGLDRVLSEAVVLFRLQHLEAAAARSRAVGACHLLPLEELAQPVVLEAALDRRGCRWEAEE